MVSSDESAAFGGQFDIYGGEVVDPPVFNPERSRCSLASMLNAEKLALDPADYMFIQPHMIKEVQPDEMTKFLIDVPPSIQKSHFVVSYTDLRTKSERYIAVTAPEAKVLPRSIPALSNNARISSRAKASGPVVKDTDQARGERAGIHAQETKLPGVTTYLETLEHQGALLQKFVTASDGRNVGLSMFGTEGSFREKFVYLQTFIIDDMVRAYGEQRKLPESSMELMAKTLTFDIVLGPNNFKHFHEFVKFAQEYNGHKQELARQRKISMERNIGQYASKLVQR